MFRLLLLPVLMLSFFTVYSQTLNYKGSQSGTFSLGQRTTLSTFNHNNATALGFGGQFRIRLSERVNTEWFADYIPATNEFTRREDYHIGWSVMYYPFTYQNELFVPYIIAGHCFDFTKFSELADRSNSIDRWSSAVQAGLGTHLNLTERLDISFSGQYMIHLGNEIHSTLGNVVKFKEHKHGSLEGHLLFTLSANFKIADLWGK